MSGFLVIAAIICACRALRGDACNGNPTRARGVSTPDISILRQGRRRDNADLEIAAQYDILFQRVHNTLRQPVPFPLRCYLWLLLFSQYFIAII